MGSPAVPWRANTGVGWEGKMKLRFVKFFTSRENEIEKKEEEEDFHCVFFHPQSGRSQSPLPFLPSSLHHFRSLSLHPTPPTYLLRRPVCRPPRVGRVIFSSYLLPSCSASPFLIHKQKSVATVTWRGTQPADLASRPNCSGRPARRTLAPHPIGCRGSSPVLMASSLWRVEP